MDDTVLLVLLFLGFMYFKSNECNTVHGNAITGNNNMYNCQIYHTPPTQTQTQSMGRAIQPTNGQQYNKIGWYLPN